MDENVMKRKLSKSSAKKIANPTEVVCKNVTDILNLIIT